MNDLIDTTEMYLRTIYDLEEEGVIPLRARIAERLEQSGPTVSQTVSRMERDGLLHVAGDRHLELTDKGRLGRRGDAQAPARRAPASRRHRAAVGGSPRRGVPLGARDERGCRAPAGPGARQPDHLSVRQPDSWPVRAGRDDPEVTTTPGPTHRTARRLPVAVVVRQFTEHVQGDAELIARLKDAGVVPNARVTVGQRPRQRHDRDPGHEQVELPTRWPTPSRSRRSEPH